MMPRCLNCRHCECLSDGEFVCKVKGEATAMDRCCGRHEWAEDDEIGRREVEWGEE